MNSVDKIGTIMGLVQSGFLSRKDALELLGFKVKNPKFKVGETVWHKHGYECIIDSIMDCNDTDVGWNYSYHLKGQPDNIWWKEEIIISKYDKDFQDLIDND